MENNNVNEQQNDNFEVMQNSIKDVITRVVTDKEFKEYLVSNPEEALKGYNLTDTQVMLLKSLDKDDFDKLTPENLTELFSADAAVYTPDKGDAYEDYEEFGEDDELK